MAVLESQNVKLGSVASVLSGLLLYIWAANASDVKDIEETVKKQSETVATLKETAALQQQTINSIIEATKQASKNAQENRESLIRIETRLGTTPGN